MYMYAYTVSFHNFKSQNFKSSVSNPKSKYAAYLSVLSQFSNCQSLGRKNKHEILKTDRTAIPAASRCRNSSGRVSMDVRMPPLASKILLETTMKSKILVRRAAVDMVIYPSP